MRNCPIIALSFLAMLAACGPTPGKLPKSADADGVAVRQTEPSGGSKQQPSATSSWSEVQPFESTSSGSTNKRKSHIVVSSDPSKHGDSLHFHFLVNNLPISGVFVAPGGQSTTFTIPVGTVHFTVDECEWEAQGFDLLPDEDIPIACKLSKEGDCCEVAIPVEEAPKANPKQNPKKAAKKPPTESADEE